MKHDTTVYLSIGLFFIGTVVLYQYYNMDRNSSSGMLGFLPYLVIGFPLFLLSVFVLMRSVYRFIRYRFQLVELLPFAIVALTILSCMGAAKLKLIQDEGGVKASEWGTDNDMGLSVLFRRNNSYTIRMRGADTNVFITRNYEVKGDTFYLKEGLFWVRDSAIYTSYIMHDGIFKPAQFVNDTSSWLHVIK